jgi:putative transposase
LGNLSYETFTMRNEEVFRRRHLPHWDVPGAAYFVTACLAGSIPAQGLLDLRRYRKELDAKPRPDDMSPNEWEICQAKLEFARIDRWLDAEPAVRHLEKLELAQVVRDSLYHFANNRYDLLAYVIMPSHIHWVFRPRDEWVATANLDRRTAREAICHSVKRHTALECNRLLGLTGAFWQDESYDHWVRDDAELVRCIEYVENNPVKAGLVRYPADWRFSSAYDRAMSRTPLGERLVRVP